MKSLFWNTLYPFVRGVFLSLFLFINTIFAQPWKRPEVASQWYFGKGAGLDFRSGVPVAVSGSICAWEGTTTFSDSVGNLLFYTDGIKVFNKNHQLMQNGDSLGAGMVKNQDCALYSFADWSSSTQGPLIIPNKNTPNLFYIFSVNCMEDTSSMTLNDPAQYSIIDLSADSGKGAVVQKNIMIHPRGTEKQAAVRHANGRDWWHVFHVANSDSFGVGLINDSLQYRFQNIGNVVWNTEDSMYAGAEMRFNWKGDMMVNLVQRKNQVNFDFFKFNRNNGYLVYDSLLSKTIENIIKVYISDPMIYSGCFSPNGHYFYTSIIDNNPSRTYLFQYNLRTKLLTTIFSSNTPYTFGVFQLAQNGVIYISQVNSCTLPAIQSPDLPYPSCGFTLSAAATQFPVINCTRQANYGLQNAAVFADPELTADLSVAQGQGCGEVVFTDSSGGHFYRLWDFGDGTWSDTLPVVQSAEFLGLTDSFQVVHHTYTDTGWFQVRLFLLHSDTLSDTLTQWIHISNCQLTATENEHFCPQSPDIQVYPNPSSGILNIQSQNPCSLRLLDLTGRLMLENPLPQATHELQLENLSKGVYLLEIERDGKKEVRKIVRE